METKRCLIMDLRHSPYGDVSESGQDAPENIDTYDLPKSPFSSFQETCFEI